MPGAKKTPQGKAAAKRKAPPPPPPDPEPLEVEVREPRMDFAEMDEAALVESLKLAQELWEKETDDLNAGKPGAKPQHYDIVKRTICDEAIRRKVLKNKAEVDDAASQPVKKDASSLEEWGELVKKETIAPMFNEKLHTWQAEAPTDMELHARTMFEKMVTDITAWREDEAKKNERLKAQNKDPPPPCVGQRRHQDALDGREPGGRQAAAEPEAAERRRLCGGDGRRQDHRRRRAAHPPPLQGVPPGLRQTEGEVPRL